LASQCDGFPKSDACANLQTHCNSFCGYGIFIFIFLCLYFFFVILSTHITYFIYYIDCFFTNFGHKGLHRAWDNEGNDPRALIPRKKCAEHRNPQQNELGPGGFEEKQNAVLIWSFAES